MLAAEEVGADIDPCRLPLAELSNTPVTTLFRSGGDVETAVRFLENNPASKLEQLPSHKWSKHGHERWYDTGS
jgi:hypothetical protein